jgi:hypothetical protein
MDYPVSRGNAGPATPRGTAFAIRKASKRNELLGKEFGGITMSGISNEQRKRDEETLAIFLVVLNLALLGAFLAVCFYQNG